MPSSQLGSPASISSWTEPLWQNNMSRLKLSSFLKGSERERQGSPTMIRWQESSDHFPKVQSSKRLLTYAQCNRYLYYAMKFLLCSFSLKRLASHKPKKKKWSHQITSVPIIHSFLRSCVTLFWKSAPLFFWICKHFFMSIFLKSHNRHNVLYHCR